MWILSIRIAGWLGIAATCLAIITKNLELFILAQSIGALTSWLYQAWLMRKHSWDNHLSLVLALAAAVTRNQWLLYSSTLIRQVSYQLTFNRLVRQTK